MATRTNGISSSAAWRSASRSRRAARAEQLRLPSGATILAAKPEPLEWVLSGRLPQRLLAVAIEGDGAAAMGVSSELSREEVLDLANFATQLVCASVVQPRIGHSPGEIPLEEIPVEDRAFIFEWACRALGESGDSPSAPLPATVARRADFPANHQEELSSAKLERFRSK